MADQLNAARETKVGDLAADFAASVKDFAAYDNPEPFFEKARRPLKDPLNIESLNRTEYFAAVLQAQNGGCVEDCPELGFRYADRELVASRTTDEASYSNGNTSRAFVRLDLLLFEDLPILAELKLARDSSAYYALVQVLTSAAEFATPTQKNRLVKYHLKDWERCADERFDLYLIFLQFNRRSKVRCEVLEHTNELAAKLLTCPQVNTHIRRIVALDADWPDRKSLRFRKLFAHSS